MFDLKSQTAMALINESIKNIYKGNVSKMNLIWLEATGCSGNIISLLNGENPGLYYLLKEMVNLKYDNSLTPLQGEEAYKEFINTLNTEFILVVEGAISLKDEGLYTIFARYKGKLITAKDAAKMAADKAKYILAVGTCSSYGGISSAQPNPTGCISTFDYLKDKTVIRIPGCPAHPDWVTGTIAHIISFGMPALDEENRPYMFYSITIHDSCTRRSFFNKGIFAKKLGDPECMFKLGCRGPVTKADCPTRKWNQYVNWPVEDNTPCIGCAQEMFPDGMEPFIRY